MKYIFGLMMIFMSIGIVSCAQKKSSNKKDKDASKDIADRIAHLPTFTAYALPDSTIFTHDSLQKDKPVVIMFFSPDCDHCQKETKELVAHKDELKDIQIVMLSNQSMKAINNFHKEYNISSMPNITMCKDTDYKFGMKFLPKQYPALYVYDDKWNLAKAFVGGNAGIAAILDAVK